MVMSHLLFLMNAYFLIRLFCCGSIAAIVTARAIPAARKRFLTYGARTSLSQRPGQAVGEGQGLLDWLATISVPHSWFTHFYVLSTVLSLFWLIQVWSRSRLIYLIGQYASVQNPGVPIEGSLLCIILMLLQSMRRLWESLMFSRKSTSRMWIGHYLFGLAFYLFVNMAVWIEGLSEMTQSHASTDIRMPRLKIPHTVAGMCVFASSSLLQSKAHAHLASLPKYSVPHHWLFKYVVAPHYLMECLIYLGIALIGAPEDYLLNGSLSWIVLLSVVNLGITAQGTKVWMMDKFREDQGEIQQKYTMIPGLW